MSKHQYKSNLVLLQVTCKYINKCNLVVIFMLTINRALGHTNLMFCFWDKQELETDLSQHENN